MLLAIDVGNSNTVLGLFEGARLKKIWRVESKKGPLVRLAKKLPKGIDGVIVSSVIPSLNHPLREMSRRFFGQKPLCVGPHLKMPIRIKVKHPQSIGADRIVNVVGGYVKYGARQAAPLLIIDFGTATTCDVVTSRGDYIGGTIAPGIKIANDILSERCAKLPRVRLGRARKAIGRTTVEAIKAGVWFGYAGLVDGTVERIQKEIGKKMKVIATGGLATLIAPAIQTIQRIDPTLTLEGLRILYKLNR